MLKGKSRNEKCILILKLALPILLLVISLSVLAGTVYGWLREQRVIRTIAAIETPFMLDIRGGDEKKISFLDLNGIDLSDEEGKDQIVFCVCGSDLESYDLELGYTTNIEFQYKIYPAVKADAASGVYMLQCVDRKNGSNTSYFYSGESLTMTKLNETAPSSGLGKLEGGHYDATYGAGFDSQYVQKNAMPIYEIKTNIQRRDTTGGSGQGYTFVDYYVLEVSWKRDAYKIGDKETDMVYLMAENSN